MSEKMKCSKPDCDNEASFKIYHRNNKGDIVLEEYSCSEHIKRTKKDLKNIRKQFTRR
jgi:hypothetical protein